jgi:hypothetical protein
MTTEAYELPAPAAWKFRRFLEHRESLEWARPSEHDGEVIALYTADQVRAAIQQERERVAGIVQEEIARAEALMTLEEGGNPVFDREQTEAGICALRTVAAAIRAG